MLLMFDKVGDEPASPSPLLHSLAEHGVEFDQAVKKESSDRLMLKPASPLEGPRHQGSVGTPKKILHTIGITQCRQNIEPARRSALP